MIFNNFNGNHSNEKAMKELFNDYENCQISYGDFFKLKK